VPEFNFTLILDGDAEQHADALYEAGCHDALLGAVNGISYAEFDREAPNMVEAIATAVAAIHSVGGLRVVRVEPEELITAAEIARRLGRSRESVRLLTTGARGRGDFPEPVSHLRFRNPLWRWSDVLAWTNADHEHARIEADFVAALNAELELARREPRLPDHERQLLRNLRRKPAKRASRKAAISR
jgi:hypothetical protein